MIPDWLWLTFWPQYKRLHPDATDTYPFVTELLRGWEDALHGHILELEDGSQWLLVPCQPTPEMLRHTDWVGWASALKHAPNAAQYLRDFDAKKR